MGTGGPEQVQAVGLGLGQSLLVTKDDSVGIVFHAAQGNESATLQCGRGSRSGKALRIDVDRGLGILQKNSLPAPVAEEGRGAAINVVAIGVASLVLAEDQADQVVGAGGVIAILRLRGDLVVGLGHDGGRSHTLRIVAEGAERDDVGHGTFHFTKPEDGRLDATG